MDKFQSLVHGLYHLLDRHMSDQVLEESIQNSRKYQTMSSDEITQGYVNLSHFLDEIDKLCVKHDMDREKISIPIKSLIGAIHYLNIALYVAEKFYVEAIARYEINPQDKYIYKINTDLLSAQLYPFFSPKQYKAFKDFLFNIMKNIINEDLKKNQTEMLVTQIKNFSDSLKRLEICILGSNIKVYNKMINDFNSLATTIGIYTNTSSEEIQKWLFHQEEERKIKK